MVFTLSEICSAYIASNIQLFTSELAHPLSAPVLSRCVFNSIKRRKMITPSTLAFYLTNERTELNLKGCSYLQNDVLLMVGRRCTNLKCLELSGASKIDLAGIRAIAHGCKQLRTLALVGCRSIDDSSLRKLSKHSVNLYSLDLSDCVNVTDRGVKYLCKLPSLRELWLDGCLKLTNAALLHFHAGLKLTALHIRGLKRITDEGLAKISALRYLDTMSMSWSEVITDDSIVFCCHEYHRLRSLDLRGIIRLTSVSLASLAQNLPLLRELDVSFCRKITDEAIMSLCMGCTQLTSIKLAGIPHLTDAAVDAIAHLGPQLEVFDMSGNGNVTDASIIHLASRAHGLLSIDLSYTGIGDPSILAIADGMHLLSSVAFSGCSGKVTDYSLISLITQCKRLSSLSLINCFLITDKTVDALANHSIDLKHIDLTGCHELTSDGLKRLAIYCPLLMTCSLNYLPKIGDVAVWHLLGCPVLQSINLLATKVSSVTIERIKQRFPNLKVAYSHSRAH